MGHLRKMRSGFSGQLNLQNYESYFAGMQGAPDLSLLVC